MEDLKKNLIESAGITDDQAQKAVEVVSKYLKDRVPPVIHSQLDKIMAGATLEESIKSQVEGLGQEVKSRAEGLANDLKEAFEGAFKSTKKPGS